jgi:hypothetical protein
MPKKILYSQKQCSGPASFWSDSGSWKEADPAPIPTPIFWRIQVLWKDKKKNIKLDTVHFDEAQVLKTKMMQFIAALAPAPAPQQCWKPPLPGYFRAQFHVLGPSFGLSRKLERY